MRLLELLLIAWLIGAFALLPLLLLGSWIADQLERIREPRKEQNGEP